MEKFTADNVCLHVHSTPVTEVEDVSLNTPNYHSINSVTQDGRNTTDLYESWHCVPTYVVRNTKKFRAAFRSTAYFKNPLSSAEHWLDDAIGGRNES